MKLQAQTGTVETSGLEEVQDFSIAVNGKAFKILLDGLYSDKVGAIVRELSTNAYDAHLAVGAGDKPFLVELPTIFNPIFRVRDYGVSMTHDRVMKLLSTVFESSKDNSNTQVGAFGLGSKSPFALVDSYTIITWQKGEKRTYNAFYQPNGTPCLAHLGTEPTTEPTGVEFSMTVDPKHVPAFKIKAMEILQWFPTHPTILGESIQLFTPEVYAEGKGWKLLKTVGGRQASDYARARQGCVVYPISASPISGLSEYHRALLGSPLLLDFPIGSLEVVASREALEYKQTTCRNIVARLNSVAHEITEHYGKVIKDAPTLWEAGKSRNELVNKSNLPRALTNLIGATKWKGTTDIGQADLRHIHMTLNGPAVAGSAQAPLNYVQYLWDTYRLRRSSSTVYIDQTASTDAYRTRVRHGDDIKVYFSLKSARPTHEAKRIRTDCGSELTVLFVVEDVKHQQIILDAMGNPPDVKWTKDLPEPVIAPRAKRVARGVTKKVEVRVREYVDNPKRPKDNLGTFEAEKVVQLTGNAYYVVTNGGQAINLGRGKDCTIPLHRLDTACYAARNSGLLDPSWPIYLVSTVYEKRLGTCSSWQPLDQVILSQEDALKKAVIAEADTVAAFSAIHSDTWVAYLRNATLRNGAWRSLGGPLAKLHDAAEGAGYSFAVANHREPEQPSLHYADQMYPFRLDYRGIREAAQAAAQNNAAAKSFNTLSRQCDAAYPLIAAVNGTPPFFSRVGHMKAFNDYIEAMDTLRAAKQTAALTATVPSPTTVPVAPPIAALRRA